MDEGLIPYQLLIGGRIVDTQLDYMKDMISRYCFCFTVARVRGQDYRYGMPWDCFFNNKPFTWGIFDDLMLCIKYVFTSIKCFFSTSS
jgi:hypothetical protein